MGGKGRLMVFVESLVSHFIFIDFNNLAFFFLFPLRALLCIQHLYKQEFAKRKRNKIIFSELAHCSKKLRNV